MPARRLERENGTEDVRGTFSPRVAFREPNAERAKYLWPLHVTPEGMLNGRALQWLEAMLVTRRASVVITERNLQPCAAEIATVPLSSGERAGVRKMMDGIKNQSAARTGERQINCCVTNFAGKPPAWRSNRTRTIHQLKQHH